MLLSQGLAVPCSEATHQMFATLRLLDQPSRLNVVFSHVNRTRRDDLYLILTLGMH